MNLCVNDDDENEDSFTSDNVLGPEADAVMMVLMAECENDKEVEVLHEIMGYNSLITMLLDKEEEDEVKKVHRYFGHKSGRKVWDLFAKAGRLAGKKKAVLKLLEDCRICKEHKKTPQRPRVGMPIANSFNEVVGLDLKVLGDGTYILWLVDMFSRGLKGAHIKDKRPETIVNAIISTWIVGMDSVRDILPKASLVITVESSSMRS